MLEADILVEHAGGYRLDGPCRRSRSRRPLRLFDGAARPPGAGAGRSAKSAPPSGAVLYPLARVGWTRRDRLKQCTLDQLEQAELVFRRGEPPEAVYSFKPCW